MRDLAWRSSCKHLLHDGTCLVWVEVRIFFSHKLTANKFHRGHYLCSFIEKDDIVNFMVVTLRFRKTRKFYTDGDLPVKQPLYILLIFKELAQFHRSILRFIRLAFKILIVFLYVCRVWLCGGHTIQSDLPLSGLLRHRSQ